MVGDVDGPGTCDEGWSNVGTEGVADHEGLLGGYVEVLAELAVFTLGLVGHGLHVGEILLKTGTLELGLLIHEFTLGEDDEAVLAAVSKLFQRFFDFRQWRGGETQQLLAELYESHDDIARQLLVADAYGILDKGEREGLGAIAGERQVLALGGKEALADFAGSSPRLEEFTALVLYLVEPGLAVPEGVVGIESHNFDILILHHYSLFTFHYSLFTRPQAAYSSQ